MTCKIWYVAALDINTAVSLKSNVAKMYYCLPSISILLFKKNICISDLLRIVVCDMVAVLLSLFPNIKNYLVYIHRSLTCSIGNEAISALYIRINSCHWCKWCLCWRPLSGQGQFIWSWKVCIWVSLGISQFIAVVSSHMLRTEKPVTLITFNMTFMLAFYANSLLNGYVFHECTWITTYTCIANYLVIAYEGLPIFISHDHFHIILMAVNWILNDIVICNLCFSDYMFPPYCYKE